MSGDPCDSCGVAAATGGLAQTTPHWLTTPIPPGIAMPDEGQTRLGPLTFFDGFPDAQAAARICDSQTRSMLQKDQDCPQTGSLDKGWDMPFRLDGPLDAWFDKPWGLGGIERFD